MWQELYFDQYIHVQCRMGVRHCIHNFLVNTGLENITTRISENRRQQLWLPVRWWLQASSEGMSDLRHGRRSLSHPVRIRRGTKRKNLIWTISWSIVECQWLDPYTYPSYSRIEYQQESPSVWTLEAHCPHHHPAGTPWSCLGGGGGRGTSGPVWSCLVQALWVMLQCIIGRAASCEQTDRYKNITFPQASVTGGKNEKWFQFIRRHSITNWRPH